MQYTTGMLIAAGHGCNQHGNGMFPDMVATYRVMSFIWSYLTLYLTLASPLPPARLAKNYELDGELLGLALKAGPSAMVEAADYLAERGDTSKAVLLYQKGGRLGKAMDLCFASGVSGRPRGFCWRWAYWAAWVFFFPLWGRGEGYLCFVLGMIGTVLGAQDRLSKRGHLCAFWFRSLQLCRDCSTQKSLDPKPKLCVI